MEPYDKLHLACPHVLIANAAQFYNPTTATWTATGPLPTTISSPPLEATLLGTGNLLGTGDYCKNTKGYNCHRAPEGADCLYSFSGNSWSLTGYMHTMQINHTATLLSNGKVLVAGGITGPDRDPTVLNSAEGSERLINQFFLWLDVYQHFRYLWQFL
jgi:hypothetical protein